MRAFPVFLSAPMYTVPQKSEEDITSHELVSQVVVSHHVGARN